MGKRQGEAPKPSSATEADLAYDLWLAKRRGKRTKDYATYGLHAKGKRRKMAMDYVAPGDGGF